MDKLRAILHDCFQSVYHGVVFLSISFVVFFLLERLFVVSRSKKPWRATLLDMQYALLSMLYQPFLYFIISAIFGYLALEIASTPHDPQLSALSFATQLLIILLVRDCLIFIRHRIFHLPAVWAFHSIHHSSEEVDWISAVRFHPAENMIEAAGEILLFILAANLGTDPAVLSVAALIMGFYNLFIHSNLRWTFGPLRYVFVSPVFHRWHHSNVVAAHDKNFAAMFSFLDLMNGTFYMPKGVLPETLGLSPEEQPAHPRTMAGQLLYPFKKHPPA